MDDKDQDHQSEPIGLSRSDEPPYLLPERRSRANKIALALTGGVLGAIILVAVIATIVFALAMSL